MWTSRELAKMLESNPDLQISGDDILGDSHVASIPVISEHDFQKMIFTEFDRRAILRSEYSLIFAIPNGGHRHPAVAAKLKAEGVKAGVLDFMIPVARHGYHGCFVELKVGNNNPSQLQWEWIRHLTAEGYLCRVFRDSVDEVVGFVEWYLERK